MWGLLLPPSSRLPASANRNPAKTGGGRTKTSLLSEDDDVLRSLLRTAGQLSTISKGKPKTLLIFQVIVVEVALGRDRRETITLEEHLSCSCQCKVKVKENFKVLFMTRTMLCTAIFCKRKASFVLSMKKRL